MAPEAAAPVLDAQGSFSFKLDTVKSPETKTAEVEKPKATEVVSPLPVMSSRTIAQIRNDPSMVEVKTRSSPPPPTASAPSGRTLQVMEELEKMKRENEMLKATKLNATKMNATSAGMSDRTRQVLDQLEQVKRENAALQATKVDKAATQQRRLAYLEQNHAAASKVRMDEIHKMILTGQELDLAFLVDATGSMQVKSFSLWLTSCTMMVMHLYERHLYASFLYLLSKYLFRTSVKSRVSKQQPINSSCWLICIVYCVLFHRLASI